jgi:RNA polymerase sigma factor (sigma-70 family)
MTADDDRLAAQATGDPQAFAALFDRFYPRVYAYMRYRFDDSTIAEDLAAQTFERLLSSLPRYDPSRAPFAAWLFAIGRHLAGDQLRVQKRRAWLPWDKIHEHRDPAPGPETLVEQRELSARLAAILPHLDARERDLLGLKFSAGLKNTEIASLTGMSASHVGVVLYRAVSRLRVWLEEADAAGENVSRVQEARHA